MRRRTIEAEPVVTLCCVTLALTLSLAVVVGLALAHALLALAPVTLSEIP